MYNKKKINFSKIIYLVFIISFLLLLTGCGKIKTSKDIIKYMKNNYKIDVEVISVEEKNDNSNVSNEKYKKYKVYTLKEKNRDITFSCTSKFVSVGIDGSTFGHSERTTDDYHKKLAESVSDKVYEIAEKYNVKFDDAWVSEINVYIAEQEEIDYKNIENAISELMSVYDLKVVGGNLMTIAIYKNDEYTGYYCNYTKKGEIIEIIDEEEEFRKEWDIPIQLEQDFMTYVNTLYSGESYVESTQIVPEGHGNYENTFISYLIINDTEKIKKDFRINLDKYREDFNNNNLQDMKSYIEVELQIVY